MANASTTITFKSKVSEEEKDAGETITMEVVPEDQEDGDTDFLFGDTAWFRVYTNLEYNVSSSDGDVEPTGVGTPKEQTIDEEKITFADEATGSTQKSIKPGTAVTLVKSSGKVLGEGSLSSIEATGGNGIKLNVPFLGTVTVSYTTAFYKHSLSNVDMPEGYDEEENENYDVIVLAKSINVD